MKKIWISAIVMSTVLVILAVAYLAIRSPVSSNNNFASLNSTGPNTFTGRIVGDALEPGTYTNLSVLSDQGCTTDPRTGLSNCTTSFATESGTAYFNYEHDMMMKPCLSIGDKINVQVSADGSAVVDRTYWAGGGA